MRLCDDYDSLLHKQSTLQSQSFYIQKQVNVGQLSKPKLLQVKSLLEMATAQIYSGRNRYQVAVEELYMLTGKAHEKVSNRRLLLSGPKPWRCLLHITAATPN
jgi:outer membrane protein TolC